MTAPPCSIPWCLPLWGRRLELRQPRPAAAALFMLGAGDRGWSLGGMLHGAAVAAPVLSTLEARHSVGLKFACFRMSLWEACLLTPSISRVNFASLDLRERGTSWRWA